LGTCQGFLSCDLLQTADLISTPEEMLRQVPHVGVLAEIPDSGDPKLVKSGQVDKALRRAPALDALKSRTSF